LALTALIKGALTGGVDYESGPYRVELSKGTTSEKFCVDITDDNRLEDDEIFFLEIDSTSLPTGVIRKDPYKVNATILDDECKYL